MTSQSRCGLVFALLAALSLAFAFAACGDDESTTSDRQRTPARPARTLIEENPENNGVQLTIGSKNFTEQFILGEIYAQALEAAGYDVSTDLNLGSEQVALKALENGEISGYPEYTSTALTSFFELPPEDVPADAQEAVDQTQSEFEELGLVAFAADAVRRRERGRAAPGDRRRARRHDDLRPRGPDRGPDPRRLARVRAADRLPRRPRAVLRPEVRRVHAGRHRPPLRGARQGRCRPLDPVHDRREAVRQRRLHDPRGRHGRAARRQRHLHLRRGGGRGGRSRLPGDDREVQEGLSLEVMQELNARVDIDKEKPEDVAADYLSETGYVE